MKKAHDWMDQDVSMDEFGASRPALKVDTIRPADATVITVSGVQKLEVADTERDDGKRVCIVLDSEEYPDRGFWLNKGGIKTLMERVGPRPRDWIGARVPLVVVRVNNPRTNVPGPVLQVASPAEWEDVLSSFDSFKGRTRRVAAKKSARKKTTARK